MKLLIGIIIAGLTIGLLFLLKIALFPVHTAVRSVDVAYGVVNKTLTSENAIREYEWFKQQEADIRKCIKNEEIAETELTTFISGLPKDRTTWGDFDKREEASLRNSLTAVRRVTNIAMEDYNAKASMANKAIFKDNLPSNISRSFYAGMQLIK
jgi:hypothetical protein